MRHFLPYWSPESLLGLELDEAFTGQGSVDVSCPRSRYSHLALDAAHRLWRKHPLRPMSDKTADAAFAALCAEEAHVVPVECVRPETRRVARHREPVRGFESLSPLVQDAIRWARLSDIWREISRAMQAAEVRRLDLLDPIVAIAGGRIYRRSHYEQGVRP
jgi:hypothetical protein